MSKAIYLDHAATTPMRTEVREHFSQLLAEPFGNPSSTHGFGRKARVVLETVRKEIARELHCQPGELIFTSGGTEADNAALLLPVRDLGIKRIITAATEHHAVLHAAQHLVRDRSVDLDLLTVDEQGRIDLQELEEKLQKGDRALVSLMHGNNEIGNLLDLKTVGSLVHRYDGLFHSDTVQTVGHFPLNLQEIPVDFITASAHKFYGPKGTGFLFARAGLKVGAMIQGGAQERNLRGGTENVASLGAMGKAFALAYQHLAEERAHIRGLKAYLINLIQQELPETRFNGLSDQMEESLYTLLSLELPQLARDQMLLFNLDLAGFAVSGGSACASGSLQGSHVIASIKPENTHPILRVSLGKDNRKEDLDAFVFCLKERLALLA